MFLSTLVFGGVQEYMRNLSFFLGGLSFFVLSGGRRVSLLILLFIPFLLMLLLQMLPLPFSLLSLLSDRRVEVATSLDNLIKSGQNFLTITYSPYITFKELLLHATGFFVAFVLYRLLDRRRLVALLYFFMALAVFESLYGIYQFALQYPGVLWEKVHFAGTARGTFINRNHFAGFLELTTFLTIAYMLSLGRWKEEFSFKNLVSSEHMYKQMVLLFISATMVTALLLSMSRGGIVSFLGGLVFFVTLIAIKLKSYRHKKEGGVYEYVLLLLLSLAVIVMSWASIGYIQSRFMKAEEDAQSRISVWLDSIKGIKEHPLLGTGGGTFEYAYYMYKERNKESLIYEHAHNDYIEYAVETGLVGAFLFFLPFFSFLFLGIRKLISLNLRKSSLEFFSLLACITGIFSILVHSLVDFNLQIPANLYLAYALVGIGGAILHDRLALSHTSGG
ncbi:MAG: O-antigen ligase family protein [Aquificaceae bacterium]|nr:O-antigen ligase family protein [Aquificaceae bacterium]